MNEFLVIAFLFFIGSLIGWIIELFYRRFFSGGREDKKWINPGFLTGPYLPLYGFSLCALYLLAHIQVIFVENPFIRKTILFIFMSLVVTLIEYVAGLIFIKRMKIKLWDYTDEWCNIKGIICPKYTFFWVVLSAIYYFAIHPFVINALHWLTNHLAFSFVIGFFYGIFCIDLCYSMNVLSRIRKFAVDNKIEVRYEELKKSIRRINEEYKSKFSFMFALKSDFSLTENLKKYLEQEEGRFGRVKKIVSEKINK